MASAYSYTAIKQVSNFDNEGYTRTVDFEWAFFQEIR